MMALKFLGAGGGSTSDAIRAVDYAVMMGAQISSNSWGGGWVVVKELKLSYPIMGIYRKIRGSPQYSGLNKDL